MRSGPSRRGKHPLSYHSSHPSNALARGTIILIAGKQGVRVRAQTGIARP